MQHGTDSMYSHRKCRCDACGAAHREAYRKYADAHRDQIAERHRQWAEKNKVSHQETRRRYRQAHRGENRDRLDRWREANPDRVQMNAMEHRYRRHGTTLSAMFDVYTNQGSRCGPVGSDACRKPAAFLDLEIDHDHACCPGNYSCGSCIRGLVCHSCNKLEVLAR